MSSPTILQKPSYPVLIVEDEKSNQILLSSICEKMGVDAVISDNGRDAMGKLGQDSPFCIYIVDLIMPEMSGKEFIEKLKTREEDPVILVQTHVDSPETIIDVMKLGVFDYILKPIDVDQFSEILSRALEFKSLRENEKRRSLQAAIRIRSELEWLNYKEARRKSDSESLERNLIKNLKTSMSQGAGFGSMVSLLELIKGSSSLDGDYYKVKRDVLDLLFENNEISMNLMDGLQSISTLLEEDFPLIKTGSENVTDLFQDILKKLDSYFTEKRIHISYPDEHPKEILYANLEYLSLILEELLINAYKYSIQGGNIDIYTFQNQGYFAISIKNDVSSDGPGGIPADYEKLVLEPFIRLHPPVESIAKLERFGLGLGLTVVEHIARKHSGMFFIHNVKDHTTGEVRPGVQAELYLPIILEGEKR